MKASLFAMFDWVLGSCVHLRSLFSVKTYAFVFEASDFSLTQNYPSWKMLVWKTKPVRGSITLPQQQLLRLFLPTLLQFSISPNNEKKMNKKKKNRNGQTVPSSGGRSSRSDGRNQSPPFLVFVLFLRSKKKSEAPRLFLLYMPELWE